jgi:predicted PhzF superfamily epimerase YddE/YHI9
MKIRQYQVDAFAAERFRGNPAAVCPLERWLPDGTMQSIAAENNLAETAFLVREPEGWRIRWFTPAMEIDLCGHATLASAWVLWSELGESVDEVAFASQSGPLTVARKDGLLELDFPSRPAGDGPVYPLLEEALGGEPEEVLASRDYLVRYASEREVRALNPDMRTLARADRFVIATAPGDSGCDFVCRFFAPSAGVPEDPVTGSAYCTLIPYWSDRLAKTKMFARQLSARGGEVWCEDRGERVGIAGRCVTFLRGEIDLG